LINIDQTLEFAKNMAEEAGKIQRSRFRENFEVNTKSSDSDLVTEVDIECEKIIRKKIGEYYPEHSILGEEEGKDDKNSDYIWVVDPLDGTNNYASGYPIYSVSIALKYRGELIIGVIYLPERDEMYYAAKDKGAFLDGERLNVSAEKLLSRSLLATGFPYDKYESDLDNFAPCTVITKQARGIRRSGSAAFDLVCAASGIIEAVWEFKLKEWDTAAGKLLITEAGGRVYESKVNGASLIIAGNSTIVDKIKDIISNIY